MYNIRYSIDSNHFVASLLQFLSNPTHLYLYLYLNSTSTSTKLLPQLLQSIQSLSSHYPLQLNSTSIHIAFPPLTPNFSPSQTTSYSADPSSLSPMPFQPQYPSTFITPLTFRPLTPNFCPCQTTSNSVDPPMPFQPLTPNFFPCQTTSNSADPPKLVNTHFHFLLDSQFFRFSSKTS